MATIQGRPRLAAPGLIRGGGDPGQIGNPFAGLAQGLQAMEDQRRRETLEAREAADRAEAARLEAEFRIEQGGALQSAGDAYDGAAPGFQQGEMERYTQALDAFLERAPESVRDRLSERLGGAVRTQHALAAQEIEYNRTRSRQLQNAVDTADTVVNAVVSQSDALWSSLEAVEQVAETLPPALRGAYISEQRERVATAWLGARLREDPAGLQAVLERGDVDGLVSPERKNQYLNAAISEQERQEALAEAEAREAEARQARAQERNYQALRVRLEEGNLDRGEIDEALADGTLDVVQWGNLAVWETQHRRRAAEAAAERDLILSGGVLDPTDPDHREAVEGAWRQLLTENGGAEAFAADPSAFRPDMVAFTQRYGVVPESAVTALQALAANGSDEQQASALDAVAAITARREGAANAAFDERTLADATAYATFASAGLDPQQALARVRASREARDNGTQDMLQRQARTWLDDHLDADMIREAFDMTPGIWGGRPQLASGVHEAAAMSDFSRLFSSYYVEHGDAGVARSQALAVMRRSWGVSRATGQTRMMQYPPERFHVVEGENSDWMQEQLESAVVEHVGGPVRGVALISDRRTAREAQSGVAPSYLVTYLDERGSIQPVPGRWSFDASALQGEAAERHRAEIEALRAAREQRLADLPFEQLEMLEAALASGGGAGAADVWMGRSGRMSARDRAQLEAEIERMKADLGDEAVTQWRDRRELERLSNMDMRGR